VLSPRNWIFATAIAVAAMSAGSLQAQAAATICKDGTTSVSSGRGACSGHGGVNKKAMKAQKKAAKAEVKADKKAAAAATPRASAKAKAKANSNSAVVSGSGAGEDNNPAGAIARCKDGLYSHAKNRRGACSRHGGVASWS
jgi:predicted  nucleic acid-binding Zn-ribbon protein